MDSSYERSEPIVIRDDLVKTACDFLAIPKVSGSSMEKKKNFLRSKGLNDDEIELAFIKSTSPFSSSTDFPNSNGIGMGQYQQQNPTSWSSSIARFSFSTVIISGICYSGYQLYKRYIQPKILRYFSDRLDTIETKLDTMIDTVRKLESETSSEKLQQTIQSHLMKTSRPNAAEIHAINELKMEISSVKALILSKRSLDLKPTATVTIPSWQLDEKLTNGNTPEQSTLMTPDEDDDTCSISNGTSSSAQGTLLQT